MIRIGSYLKQIKATRSESERIEDDWNGSKWKRIDAIQGESKRM